MMKVGRPSIGPMETNVDPYLQEEKSTMGPVGELVEVQIDPKDPSKIVKICKCPSSELAEQLVEFLNEN